MSTSTIHVHVREHEGKAQIAARQAVLLSGRGPDGDELPDTFKAGELILGALGTCTVGTVRAYAKQHGITGLTDVQVDVRGHEADLPSRIVRAEVILTLQGSLSADDRVRLRQAAATCKIGHTLKKGIEIQIAEAETAIAA
jgi:uncharacterized OsmC-like protein